MSSWKYFIYNKHSSLKHLCQVAVGWSQTKPTCSNIKTCQTQSQRFRTNVAKCPIFLLEFHRIRGPLSVLVRGYLCMKNLLSMPTCQLEWRHLAPCGNRSAVKVSYPHCRLCLLKGCLTICFSDNLKMCSCPFFPILFLYKDSSVAAQKFWQFEIWLPVCWAIPTDKVWQT